MPKMGESITEGTIINWLVAEGDSFEEGDIILEVATDKVDNEVPAPASGTLVKTLFQAKDIVPVGTVMAILGVSEKSSIKKEVPVTSSATKTPSNKKTIKEPKQIQPVANDSTSFSVNNTNTFFSPLIISIAKEHHISFEELARIPATGQEGRLRKSDVFQYIEDGRPYKFAQPVTQVKMDRMRQMIADHMVYSKHTSPHVTAYVEADLTQMVNWRNAHKKGFQEKYGERLTFTPLFVEAVAKAVKDFPNIKI